MHDTCVMLSTILEDLCYMSAKKEVVSMNSMQSMSRVRLWAGLWDSQIKNALRHRKDALNIEDILIQTRIMEEKFEGKKEQERESASPRPTRAEHESTLQTLVKKVEELGGMTKKRQNNKIRI